VQASAVPHGDDIGLCVRMCMVSSEQRECAVCVRVGVALGAELRCARCENFLCICVFGIVVSSPYTLASS